MSLRKFFEHIEKYRPIGVAWSQKYAMVNNEKLVDVFKNDNCYQVMKIATLDINYYLHSDWLKEDSKFRFHKHWKQLVLTTNYSMQFEAFRDRALGRFHFILLASPT